MMEREIIVDEKMVAKHNCEAKLRKAVNELIYDLAGNEKPSEVKKTIREVLDDTRKYFET